MFSYNITIRRIDALTVVLKTDLFSLIGLSCICYHINEEGYLIGCTELREQISLLNMQQYIEAVENNKLVNVREI